LESRELTKVHALLNFSLSGRLTSSTTGGFETAGLGFAGGGTATARAGGGGGGRTGAEGVGVDIGSDDTGATGILVLVVLESTSSSTLRTVFTLFDLPCDSFTCDQIFQHSSAIYSKDSCLLILATCTYISE
jgi:hypothetical protein